MSQSVNETMAWSFLQTSFVSFNLDSVEYYSQWWIASFWSSNCSYQYLDSFSSVYWRKITNELLFSHWNCTHGDNKRWNSRGHSHWINYDASNVTFIISTSTVRWIKKNEVKYFDKCLYSLEPISQSIQNQFVMAMNSCWAIRKRV